MVERSVDQTSCNPMIHPTDSSVDALYRELRDIASDKLRFERADHTLQATALVNEALLKLGPRIDIGSWEDRSHFLRVATEAMRQILVDHARARLAQKRGARFRHESAKDIPMQLPLPSEEIIAIHECLDAFESEDPVKAQLVKLRIFAGFSHAEAAKELGISRQTADRYWAYAKVRLFSMIR